MNLHNTYYAMRHGRSLANERGLIVSDPAHGLLLEYGLSDAGKRQVVLAAHDTNLDARTLIYTSDFSRARQTAEIVQRIIAAPRCVLALELRERFFGEWELTSHDNYSKVWKADASRKTNAGVESPDHVLARTWRLIKSLEQTHQGEQILLVSHGDTLQILQAGFAGYDPWQHRQVPHMETAEIRRLT